MACIKKNTVFCILFLALYAVFCRVEALDQCYYDSGCSYLQHCCERKFPEDNVCVGSVASGSLVLMTATVHRVNVVILITNVQQRALENRVPIMATVLLVNIVAIIMKDVKPLAL